MGIRKEVMGNWNGIAKGNEMKRGGKGREKVREEGWQKGIEEMDRVRRSEGEKEDNVRSKGILEAKRKGMGEGEKKPKKGMEGARPKGKYKVQIKRKGRGTQKLGKRLC